MEKEKLLKMVDEAHVRLKEVVTKTPLQLNKRLSKKYGAKIYLKREGKENRKESKNEKQFKSTSPYQ